MPTPRQTLFALAARHGVEVTKHRVFALGIYLDAPDGKRFTGTGTTVLVTANGPTEDGMWRAALADLQANLPLEPFEACGRCNEQLEVGADRAEVVAATGRTLVIHAECKIASDQLA